ncbi:MAG: lipopolysaccharide export system permease protein [Thermodesulfobacteriota bacterium]|nr:lipopolysaccharide export system permease protein [Thermodesulfobacteriota bacterium]
MKINSIVNRYLFKEMIPPFLINMVFFTFLFLMAKILFITNLVVNHNIGLSRVILMLFLFIPYFLVFVIPMSVMMAVLLTFLRLSSDNELTALKTGGVSLYGLLPPVIIFCLIGCVLTLTMSVYGMPWGRASIKRLTMEVAASNLELGLRERTFNNNFKDVMLYVSEVDMKKGELRDVFVEDKRSESIVSTIVAPRGILFFEKSRLIFRLRLFDGKINQVSVKNKSVNSIGFETYDINLDLKSAYSDIKGKGGIKDEKEMSFPELRDYLSRAENKNSRYFKALIELHQKISIPFACFVLGILAVSLGAQLKSARRSFGLGLGLIFFLFYYLLLSIGYVFKSSEWYPPFVGMWVPNIVTGGIGLFLLVKTASERPVFSMLAWFFKRNGALKE